MNLLHLVDRLEELVGGAQRMPIGSRVMIDRRRLLDLIDQMRVAIPQEVREAQRMVSEQERLHREAEEEARLIVARAEEQATRLISEHEIMRQAERHAEDLTRQAEARLEQRVSGANDDIRDRIEESRRLTDQQMRAADDYGLELLERLERQLQAFVGSVESGIAQLQPPPTASASPWDALVGGSEASSEFDASPDASTADGRDDETWGDEGWDDGARGGEGAAGNRRATVAPPLLRPAEEPELDLLPSAPGVIDDFSLPSLDDERAYEAPADDAPDEDR
jgi:F0F1-type ATP synthase membrane subunit b/b'